MTTLEQIFFGGRIYTLDENNPWASVLAVRERKLVYVGNDLAAATAVVSPAVRPQDLGGCSVLPGLIDSHMHLMAEGARLSGLTLNQLSLTEVLAAVRREAAELPAGEWIVGHGWNQEDWPGRLWPTRVELDKVAPDHPIILDRCDKHSVWVNSQALARAGLTAATPDPLGGEILRTGEGDFLGILTGSAIKLVRSLVPVVGEEKLHQDLLRAQTEFLGFGVTGGMEASTRLRELAIMKKVAKEGLLKLRLQIMLYAGTNEDQEYLAAGGQPEKWSSDKHLNVGGLKIISDGSLGSRTAWLLSDYADRPSHRGQPGYSDKELTAIMARARRYGLQVAVHAIGDAGVHQTLTAMRRVLEPEPGDYRWRVEHFQVVSEEDRDLALALGVIPSIQAAGLMTDLDLAEERLGPIALAQSYRWREILDRGGILVGGSDAPIESANPFVGIYAAVTRQNLKGRPPGGWRPADRLTRLEALKSYTIWAAWAIFAENYLGSLVPGHLADFIVLDRDPLTCPEVELKAVKVFKTVIGGEVVFER
ncbi:MAG: hypothetical protein AMR96_00015 [Candidatus Adiutrix intracellularis]|nr:MAG: hypothetical protein AMR96_00015 [Candidatus Adiutrix intracellularis]MDR2827420.1 amidohydrolase [Candidatus Adiutrix intracellularis]